jgi:4-amino-4-deoxy-L-arabinose transferase-like glycosyltransferase
MSKTRSYSILIAFLCSVLFLPFLGGVHLFDWDEINFAECAREMIVSNNYSVVTINFLPFWEKPPLFIWLQALSMNLFGVNEFAARLPNALCGIVTSVVLFNIGTKIKNNTFGFLWVLTYLGSFLPHFYFKSGIIDPWFNLFIFLGTYFMALHTNPTDNNTENKNILLSALFIGLGILTKGPVAFLIYFLCIVVYLVITRFKKIISFKQTLLGAIIIFFIGGFWFILQVATGHLDIIIDFFNYQVRLLTTEDSGHGGPVYYHLLVLLLGCFPASIFAIRGFKTDKAEDASTAHLKKWMIILFAVVLILFSLVKTKIVHYSSLCYFPLSFLAAYSIEKIISGEITWKKWMGWLIGIIGITIGLIISLPPFIDWNKEKIIASNIIKDDFAVENLKATVQWSGYDVLPGIIYMIGIVVVLVLFKKKNFRNAIVGLFVLSLITVNLVSILVVPKVEKYSQGAAIEFYEGLRNKDCYVETLGFKSYAHFFYAQTKQSNNINNSGTEWLMTGNIDKPVYFVCKINHVEEYQKAYPQLKELYRKNGFVFFVREL